LNLFTDVRRSLTTCLALKRKAAPPGRRIGNGYSVAAAFASAGGMTFTGFPVFVLCPEERGTNLFLGDVVHLFQHNLVDVLAAKMAR
jgi:hypothetical protein